MTISEAPQPLDSKLLELARNHSWNYFQLHAQQRLTTFNFYIVLSSVLTTALFTALQKDGALLVAGAIGLLLGTFSFVFAKLDVRNRQLIQNGELSLRALEAQWKTYWPAEVDQPTIDLFTRDEVRVAAAKSNRRFWTVVGRHWSYSDCFGMAFWGLGTLGFGVIAVALLLYWADFWLFGPAV